MMLNCGEMDRAFGLCSGEFRCPITTEGWAGALLLVYHGGCVAVKATRGLMLDLSWSMVMVGHLGLVLWE